MLPAQGQVAQGPLGRHLVTQQGAVVTVELHLCQRPGCLAHQRGQGLQATLPVHAADLGDGRAGVGFPVGRCSDAQQGAKTLLAGRGCCQVQRQQARHAAAHQRAGDEGRTHHHRARGQRRRARWHRHHAAAFGQGQGHHHRQRQAQAGMSQPRRANHLDDGDRHREEGHPRRMQAPAGQRAHQAHLPEPGEQHRAHPPPGGGRRRLCPESAQHCQAAVAEHHQGAHQRRLRPAQHRCGHRAQQAD